MTIFDPDPDDARPVAVIDFEASCYPMPGSFPIEVALAFVQTGEVRSWLIRPSPVWLQRGVWEKSAEAVHGLTLDKLKAEGLTVERVISELAEAAKGHAVVSDAAGSDAFWLEQLAFAAAWAPPFQVEPIMDLLRQAVAAEHPDLPLQARDVEVEKALRTAMGRYPEVHRAAPDARRLAEALRILTHLSPP